jgi:periplasmic protein CpxP/Spy
VKKTEMHKPRRFKMMAIATLSAIALAASIAVAQTVTPNQGDDQGARAERREGRGRGKHKGHGWGGMRRGGFFGQLNLTEDQKTKMKQIRESFAERNKPLRQELRAKRQELRQASEGGTFNEALATQKLTEMASLEAKLMAERHKLHQETLSVLTAEQKAQLEQSKAQRKARRGEMRGNDNQ